MMPTSEVSFTAPNPSPDANPLSEAQIASLNELLMLDPNLYSIGSADSDVGRICAYYRDLRRQHAIAEAAGKVSAPRSKVRVPKPEVNLD